MRRAMAVLLITFGVGVAVLSADTLILLDGSRIEGRVLGMRDDTIEFEERGTRRRVVRHRDEIARIEFNSGRNERPERPSFGGGPGIIDQGTGRPQGMLRRDVEVRAREAFTDTGIRVRSGQLIYVEASGEIRWGRGGREDGPEGEKNSPINNGRPIPAAPAAALIGRVGDDNRDLFLVGGDQGPFRMRASGTLFLGVNDDTFQDNSGSFRVVIYY
jgi:PA-IL-like protein